MIPESLKKVLERRADKPAQKPAFPFIKGITTTIWRDGEVYREEPGKKTRQLKSITPI